MNLGPKAGLKTTALQTLRDYGALPMRAKRLECGAFTAAGLAGEFLVGPGREFMSQVGTRSTASHTFPQQNRTRWNASLPNSRRASFVRHYFGCGCVVLWLVTSLALWAAPLNDLCAGAEGIPASGPFPHLTTVADDITAATTTGDPPLPSCLVGSVSHSVWYQFTPAATATYTLSTCLDTGSTVKDTVLALYTSAAGCVGPFTEVACSDDTCGIRAALSTTLTAGTTYYIVIWKFGTLTPAVGATAIQLRVSVPFAPPNDLCAGAQVIPAAGPFPHFTAPADTTLATTSGDPPRPSCGSQLSRSVWYQFTPAHTAAYVISACHPETATTVYDTVLAIYSAPGGCGGALAQVACNDDACTFRSAITTRLNQGMTYYLVVWEAGNVGYTVGETAVQLRVTEVPVRITSASFLPNAAFQMRVDGVLQPGTLVIEASTDLAGWAPVFTNTTPTNVLFYTDPEATSYPWRFYRAFQFP